MRKMWKNNRKINRKTVWGPPNHPLCGDVDGKRQKETQATKHLQISNNVNIHWIFTLWCYKTVNIQSLVFSNWVTCSICHLDDPSCKVDLGGKGVALLPLLSLRLTYPWNVSLSCLLKVFWSNGYVWIRLVCLNCVWDVWTVFGMFEHCLGRLDCV